jgi:hypothetical protein
MMESHPGELAEPLSSSPPISSALALQTSVRPDPELWTTHGTIPPNDERHHRRFLAQRVDMTNDISYRN